MFLKEISLKNVRIFSDLRTDFNPKINIIHGKNGQGKTSILEAIYYTSLTKSFRTNKDAIVLKNEADFFEVNSLFLNENNKEITSRIYYSEREGKHAFLNGQKVKQFSELVGLFPVILLSLDDLDLTYGVPSTRRRFLDILLSQLFPGYLQNLRNYKKCITQKNKLLNSEEVIQKEDINIWNQQIIDYGSRIIFQRKKFIDFANDKINTCYKKISGKEEQIEVVYNSTIQNLQNEFELKEINQLFKQALAKQMESEIKRKLSLTGPHKDDLDFFKNGFLFKSHGSQGENKSFLMALKTVESNYIQYISKKMPLFLLDDIFGELDSSRVKNLVYLINDQGQTFITTTDLEKFKNIFPENSKLIFINNHVIQ
jgi:DNA replication and repair protein RecF